MVMIDTALNAYPDRLAAPACWRLSIAVASRPSCQILQSSRGSRGGYELARSSPCISIEDIVMKLRPEFVNEVVLRIWHQPSCSLDRAYSQDFRVVRCYSLFEQAGLIRNGFSRVNQPFLS
jgi:hypothetical protein